MARKDHRTTAHREEDKTRYAVTAGLEEVEGTRLEHLIEKDWERFLREQTAAAKGAVGDRWGSLVAYARSRGLKEPEAAAEAALAAAVRPFAEAGASYELTQLIGNARQELDATATRTASNGKLR